MPDEKNRQIKTAVEFKANVFAKKESIFSNSISNR
jgi:hypothetical protein